MEGYTVKVDSRSAFFGGRLGLSLFATVGNLLFRVLEYLATQPPFRKNSFSEVWVIDITRDPTTLAVHVVHCRSLVFRSFEHGYPNP